MMPQLLCLLACICQWWMNVLIGIMRDTFFCAAISVNSWQHIECMPYLITRQLCFLSLCEFSFHPTSTRLPVLVHRFACRGIHYIHYSTNLDDNQSCCGQVHLGICHSKKDMSLTASHWLRGVFPSCPIHSYEHYVNLLSWLVLHGESWVNHEWYSLPLPLLCTTEIRWSTPKPIISGMPNEGSMTSTSWMQNILKEPKLLFKCFFVSLIWWTGTLVHEEMKAVKHPGSMRWKCCSA